MLRYYFQKWLPQAMEGHGGLSRWDGPSISLGNDLPKPPGFMLSSPAPGKLVTVSFTVKWIQQKINHPALIFYSLHITQKSRNLTL